MAVDWGLAGLVSGVGFGAIFIVLIILAIVIWLVGLVLSKISVSKSETVDKKKGG